MRRRILRLRRFNWRWRLAFTRKPPGGERTRVVKYLDCSLKPGGFRVCGPRSAWGYAWLRTNQVGGHRKGAIASEWDQSAPERCDDCSENTILLQAFRG